MDNKPSRSSAVPPPSTTNPSMVTSSRKMIGVDVRYLMTIPGILKMAEIIIGIICSAVCGKAYFSGNQFFLFVTVICIIITFILLFLNFAKIPKLFSLPGGFRMWALMECVYAATAALFYAIASSVQIARTNLPNNPDVMGYPSTYGRYTAAGIIAFLNFFLYCADAYIHYRSYKGNQIQGPV